ncbi:cyclic AMP-responsive element-binding protein 1 isoform X3 [Anthonomus grandis grandis]|uniref:cyclic AMP-responsive element-binding protein 1 isoform X3 n=1 Tax=Anthonomus grandis grandis TaxID=2921223 RepID=UPI00216556FD|nr:cyclic AMP-responsive element-binding protein 1 isoform X3 [Anthonomus grandis grandis]
MKTTFYPCLCYVCGAERLYNMDAIEEKCDPLSTAPESPIASSVGTIINNNNSQSHLVAATNIVQLTIPHSQAMMPFKIPQNMYKEHTDLNQTLMPFKIPHNIMLKEHTDLNQVQSVIQPNQQSVIQTAANIAPIKGNVILLSKPNSVIQTTQGLQAVRVVEAAGSDDSYSDEESPKKRRDLLTRRPSYRKILNDLGGGEIAEPKVEQNSSEADSELSSHSIPYHTVLPATAIQISSGEGGQGIHTLTMTNSTAGGAIVQYSPGQEFFVPVVTQGGGLGQGGGEDQARKREMRLLKNREAARECRRKKKEYIKCLENRVAVLENQNKTLIDELTALKELYCQQKTE